ncbi:molybdate transport repressor ModE-like protein [Aquabacterium commune]|uniref:Molybdate transport repressor ModE-like protein n=1 Tax=Aquabacterium commune TaxID=70586 RepID=A0A4R6RPQ5_9BURK|nr:substrate-binding domain-containing protein [Aquabacterium commune]TDP88195.1 molybdate transport repressor ModE-like protein [Aquabacterium commune]
MHTVSITPHWTITDDSGQQLSPRLLSLLAEVQEHGSLSGACKHTGASYRHAWNLVRQGQAQLGMPLLNMDRGKGSTLTPLAERLVWAGHRIQARLSPTLESLASELEAELGRVLSAGATGLRVHASHGFAVEKLLEVLAQRGERIDRKYVGSQEGVASLHAGSCDLAGFHVPQGVFEDVALQHYAQWLSPKHSRVIHMATRRQGLFVAHGNPLEIYGVQDLARKGVRFVNRQPSSGTRFLLECCLRQAKVPTSQIAGWELAEFTHAAVAAYVASGMADVGFGVEPPARRFKLDFVPVATERYFFLCRDADLQRPELQAVLEVMRGEAFHAVVNALPGYSAVKCGQVETLQKAFPQMASGRRR